MENVTFMVGSHGPFKGSLVSETGSGYVLSFENIKTGLRTFRNLPNITVQTKSGLRPFIATEYFVAPSKSRTGILGRIQLHNLS